jgi:hypothetical protein
MVRFCTILTTIELHQCLTFILSFHNACIKYLRGPEKMSFEASLDRYLMEHKGERIHINLLTKRFNSLPNTIIHKLKLFNWRHCGGGYWYS